MGIDLYGAEVVDVFQKGDDTNYRYYRLPSIAVSAAGTVLVACEGYLTAGGDWSGGHILIRRSIDGGKTWLPPQVVADSVEGQAEKNPMATARNLGVPGAITFDNAVLITDRSGAIHLLYCVEYMRCFYMRSDDEGATFTPAVEITSAFEAFRKDYPWKVLALGPGHGIQLSNGRLLVPVWISPGTAPGAHSPSVAATIYSDDHGQTWQAGDIAIPDAETWDCPNEGTVVELADGRVLLDVRSNSQTLRRLQVTSPDGATGWSKPEFNEHLYEPVCAASMTRFSRAADGHKNRILFVNPFFPEATVRPTRRRNLTVKLSYDEGQTWPIDKVVEPGFAGYSDLAVLPDGTILCVYEGGYHYPARLTVARFDLEWLTDGLDSCEKEKDSCGQCGN
jgi:sialidase-1